MCVMSMVMDHYNDKWKNLGGFSFPAIPEVSRQEFDALKKDLLEMKELLKRAKIYDEQTGQPDCESQDKIAMLRKLAEAVGLNLDELLPAAKPSSGDPK